MVHAGYTHLPAGLRDRLFGLNLAQGIPNLFGKTPAFRRSLSVVGDLKIAKL